VLVAGISIALSHFGLDVTILWAVIVASAIVIALGTRSVVSDAIGGFLILVDRPFRVGDAVLLESLDTWGEVLEIGAITTRIRTRDNREVVVPNSKIRDGQVTNYSYPDPRYRVQIDIGVAYGSDHDQVRSVIQDAVRGVEGVLPDGPVDVLYLEFGGSTRVIRVRWWVEGIRGEKRVRDRVNVAIERALDDAGIAMPFTTYDLNLKMAGPVGDDQPDPFSSS
jgi:small-conductance mechanosensitive channel